MTTNSPATPLPWAVPGTDGGEYVICSDGSHGKRRTVAHGYESTNAAYIVKSANAYPQLVEALREHIADLTNYCKTADEDDPAHVSLKNKRDLLRSLGEKV